MNNNCKFFSFLPQIASGWPLSPLWMRYGGRQGLKYSLSLYVNLEVLYLFISYCSTSISCISHPPSRNLSSGHSTHSPKCFILMSQAQREWMVETPFLEDSKLRGAPVWGAWAAGVGRWEQSLILSGSRSCGAPPCTRCRLPVWEQILCRHQMLQPQRLIKVSLRQVTRSAPGK